MSKLFNSGLLFTGIFLFFNIAQTQESKPNTSQEKSALDQLPIAQSSPRQVQVPAEATPEAPDSIPPALIAPLHLASMPELDERLLASSHEAVVTPVIPSAEVEVVEDVKSSDSEPEVEGQLQAVQ